MITYIDEKNTEQYTALFAEASTKSGKNIKTLEDYISNIKTLSSVSNKFVRLPIDEDVFEIDADARTITVPKTTFGKNGIGVVGDELAEIVYFKINRFFDIADLANGDKKIAIQWTNAKKEQGISWAYAIDKDTDPNYLYFGWALNNKITKTAGNITFNVRIFAIKDNTLTYSLSTQNATVAVKAAQNFDMLDTSSLIVDDSNTLIAERIMDANVAHSPKLLSQLSEEADIGNTLTIQASADEGANVYAKWFKDNVGLSNYVKLTANADGNYESALTITSLGEYYVVFMEAVEVTDLVDSEGNKIEYHTTTGRVNSGSCNVPLPVKVEITTNLTDKYILGVTAENPQMTVSTPTGTLSGKAYKSDTEKGTYTEDASITVTVAGGVASFAPTAVGYYKLQVNNTRNTAVAEGDLSTACRITKPAKVDKIELSATKADGTTIIAPTTTAKKTNYVANMILVADVTTADGSDSLKYQWYQVKGEEDPETGEEVPDLAIENGTEAKLQFPAGPNKDLMAGQYYVKVINTLNGDVSAEKKSTTITLQ